MRFFTRIFSRAGQSRGRSPARPAATPPTLPASPIVPPPAPPPASPPLAPPPGLHVHRWGPENGRSPTAVVFLCHGMGSHGGNIIEIAPKLGAVLREVLFVAPDGPEPAPQGGDGHAWFDASDRSPAALAAGVRRTAVALNATIDAELARAGLPEDAYALAGYSQGAMTVLFTGLRRSPGPRAIFSFAGALIAPETLADELANRAPVMLAHGLADPVVPAFYSRDAERALRAARVPVQGVYLPGGGHVLDAAGFQAGKEFLRRWLVPEAAGPAAARRSLAGG